MILYNKLKLFRKVIEPRRARRYENSGFVLIITYRKLHVLFRLCLLALQRTDWTLSLSHLPRLPFKRAHVSKFYSLLKANKFDTLASDVL